MGEKRRVLIVLLILCFIVVSISEIWIVQAQSTIYIRADGSVEGTDKIQREGNIYTFTDNIVNQFIVVEKDDIVVDGAGYTLQGTGVGEGIGLDGRSNVTIKNVEITNFRYGIMLLSSSNNVLADNNAYSNTWAGIELGVSSNNNTVSENNIANNNMIGIRVDSSSFNIVSGNNITNNDDGVFLWSLSNNKFYHNIFINNWLEAGSWNSSNTWDDGYPSGGNYWSNYTDVDLYSGPDQDESGSDGIWDHPYIINEDNQDNYL